MTNIEVEVKFEITLEKYNELKRALQDTSEDHIAYDQTDLYFSPANQSYYDNGDRCLRIRSTNEKNIISYKQIHNSGEKDSYIEEYETEVGDSKAIAQILTSIGYNRELTIVKHRDEYQYKGVYFIALDEVEELGYFIEIEDRSEYSVEYKRNRLGLVTKQFGLVNFTINDEGYSNMLYRLKKEKGAKR